jgi:hypothetical protein
VRSLCGYAPYDPHPSFYLVHLRAEPFVFALQEWQDEESDEWHEDTFEWKRKEAQKKAVRAAQPPNGPSFVLLPTRYRMP